MKKSDALLILIDAKGYPEHAILEYFKKKQKESGFSEIVVFQSLMDTFIDTKDELEKKDYSQWDTGKDGKKEYLNKIISLEKWTGNKRKGLLLNIGELSPVFKPLQIWGKEIQYKRLVKQKKKYREDIQIINETLFVRRLFNDKTNETVKVIEIGFAPFYDYWKQTAQIGKKNFEPETELNPAANFEYFYRCCYKFWIKNDLDPKTDKERTAEFINFHIKYETKNFENSKTVTPEKRKWFDRYIEFVKSKLQKENQTETKTKPNGNQTETGVNPVFEVILNTIIAEKIQNRTLIKIEPNQKKKFIEFEKKLTSFDWIDTDWKLIELIKHFRKVGYFQYLSDTDLFEVLAKNVTFKGKQKTKNNLQSDFNRAKHLHIYTDFTAKLKELYSKLKI